MRTTLFLASALGLLAACAAASDVIEVKEDEFAGLVGGDDLTLVAFTAPWCGHCKALHPQYEEAASILKDHSVKLARVDCTVEATLCSAHGVNGYPTLKVFRNGESSDYGGNRKTEGIVSYMKKQALPAVSDVTAANHSDFTGADRLVVVSYLDGSDTTNRKIFDAFAQANRDDYLFGVSTDAAAASAAGVQAPAIVLYKTFDEGRNDYVGSFTPEGLTEFLRDHSVPLFDEISPENFALYAEADVPLAYTFIEASDSSREALVKSLEPIARENKGKINFVWIDATKFADHAKSLNLGEAKWPAFAIQNIKEMQKFPLDQSKNVDASTVGEFVRKFVAGEIPASIKSEPVPKTQDEAVYVLVADEFEKVTSDPKKDYFVEFYAPWCGHCKRLAPIYETLAEKYASVKDKLIIAKFDATENDVPASAGKVTGFPTLRFKPAGSSTWITYEGDRSIESLTDFVESNSNNDLSANVTGGSAAEQVVLDSNSGHDEL